MKKILILGPLWRNRKIVKRLKKNYKVFLYNKKIDEKYIKFKKVDFLITSGYPFLVKKKILKIVKIKINLHISYLPYNRGAHPNFWSFIDNTPKGVSIHEIDPGIDTGKIIFRQKLKINPYKKKFSTFKKTHTYLINQIEKLFIKKFKKILTKKYKSFKQKEKNTYHLKSSLPVELKNWNTNIIKFKKSYIKNHFNK